MRVRGTYQGWLESLVNIDKNCYSVLLPFFLGAHVTLGRIELLSSLLTPE